MTIVDRIMFAVGYTGFVIFAVYASFADANNRRADSVRVLKNLEKAVKENSEEHKKTRTMIFESYKAQRDTNATMIKDLDTIKREVRATRLDVKKLGPP